MSLGPVDGGRVTQAPRENVRENTTITQEAPVPESLERSRVYTSRGAARFFMALFSFGITELVRYLGTRSEEAPQARIAFEAKENVLYFIAHLAPLTNAQKSLKSLLRASFLGKETGYASIGIENNDLMLLRMLTLPMAYTYFENSLDLFVKAVRYWK